MLSPIGFWSYSNTDDDHSRGRLSQLRALLASELQQKIGRKLKVNIFQDVAAIPPGAEWEKQIRDAINGSIFLIPIVTPALLQSEWCCQEITLFRQREISTLRRSDLIFPLHYLNVDDRDPSRTEDCHDAEVFRFLRSRQWTDFRALRHKNPESEDVARKIDALADAICSALRRPEQDQLNVEEESHRKVTAQVQDRARIDNDRRKDKTKVKAETEQKRLEAEAKRAEEERKKSAADKLANEERRRREARAEQERGQAAQQQAENQSPRSRSEPKGRLGEREHRTQSPDRWPMWLDIRSWSYFRIAFVTATLGLIAFFSDHVLNLYGLRLGGAAILLSARVLYTAMVLLLVAPLTESPKIERFAVLFVGVYALEFVLAYTRIWIWASQNVPPSIDTLIVLVPATLARVVIILLEWFLIAYAASLIGGFTDRKFLGIAAIVSIAASITLVILRFTLPSELSGWVSNAFYFSTTALLVTFGIRRQTNKAPVGN